MRERTAPTPRPKQLALSVVVPTLGRSDHLLECLVSVRKALRQIREPTELVLVDNGSEEGALDEVLARFRKLVVVRLAENGGFAGGVMAGIRRSSGEWIALLNDDLTVERDALAELLRVGRTEYEIGSVAAQMRFAGNRELLNSAGIVVDRLGVVSDRLVGRPIAESEDEPVRVFGASGGAGLFRRLMLAEAGGFDESFFAFLEDGDLAWRARMLGWESVYAPGAVVYHHHSATAGHGSTFKHYLVGRNRVRLLAKNASRSHLTRNLAAIVAYDLAYVAFAAVAYRTLAPLRGRIRGLREWRKYRHRGAYDRRSVDLPPSPGVIAALRRNRAWTAGKEPARRPSLPSLPSLPSRPALPAIAALRRPRVSPLSPLVAFPAVWVLGVVLAQIQVLSIQRPWSHAMWAVVVATPAAFLLGGLLATELVRRFLRARPAEPAEPPPEGRRILRLALVGCLVVGVAETVHQFAKIRAIPLLSSNIDQVRVKQGGPTIVLTDLLTVAAIVALVTPRKLLDRSARFELGVAATALAAFALAGGRVVVAIPVVAAFFARALHWGLPRLRTVATGGAVALLLIGGLFYVRSAQHANDSTGTELFRDVVPSTPPPLRPLVPFQIGMATNYEALARVVDYFPRQEPYGGWRYDAEGFDLFFPGAKSLVDVTSNLSGPWITATVAGPFWADGGIALVVVGLLLIGALTCAAYAWARRAPSLPANLLAGYLLFLALFGFYQNLYTQHADWLLVAPLLGACGLAAERRLSLRRLAAVRRAGYEASDPETEGEGEAMKETERERRNPRRRAAARRRLLVAVGVLTAALVGAIVYAVTRSDPAKLPPAPPLEASERFPLPPGIFLTPSTRVATDGDTPLDNDPLWVFSGGPETGIAKVTFGPSRLVASTVGLLVLGPTWNSTTLDVARWGASGDDAVFAIRAVGRGVSVRVFRPGRTSRVIAGGVAALEPVPSLTQRVYAIATWSGILPDLFVFDFGSRRERVRIRAFSGESLFRNLIVAARVPFLGGQSPEFSFDFGVVTTPLPDLIFVGRTRTVSGRAEVHVLNGENDFSSFFVERPLDLPTNLPASYRFVYGSTFGRGAVYGLDGRPRTPKLDLFAFFPRGD